MKADVGDWLVVKGRTNGDSDRRGIITEVRSADGTPPYLVHWLESGRLALVFPGPDAVVVTASEQQAADERERSRLATLQTVLTGDSVQQIRGT
jgi:hypothetical protein